MGQCDRDLQIISFERTEVLPQRGVGQDRRRMSAPARRKKRLKQKRRLKKAGILCITAALLFTVSYWTNWFTEIPGLENKTVRLKRQVESLVKKAVDGQADYPAELVELMEQNEETVDFVKNYAERDRYIGKEINLSDSVEAGSVPLLMQWDKRWGYDLYGDAMIGLAGCGPTCMTMAYLYYTGDLTMNPRKMAEYAQERGYHTEEGTSWSFWTDGAADIGLYGEQISLSENNMKAVLDCGGLLVCSMSPGDFTTKGHFILLRGYDEHGFFVHDPNRKENSKKQWEYDTLSTQIKNLWAIYDN